MRYAVWEGEFPLFGVSMKVSVLDDGERVIHADSMEALFSAIGECEVAPDEAERQVEKFVGWMRTAGV